MRVGTTATGAITGLWLNPTSPAGPTHSPGLGTARHRRGILCTVSLTKFARIRIRDA